MLLIPVLDLAAGVAVHARGGDRADYRPVQSVLIPGKSGSALLLARAYREELGARQCYAADLDAIRGGEPQHALLRALADPARGFGDGLLVDAGVGRVDRATDVLDIGAGAVVAGLETLDSFDTLAMIVASIGAERVVFSLDLRDGVPVRSSTSSLGVATDSALDLATRAAKAGARRILVLDLARVGQGGGVDLGLIRSLKHILPEVLVLAGGGIRGPGDLAQLRATGCDGALVGTAIHEGRITANDFVASSPGAGSLVDNS